VSDLAKAAAEYQAHVRVAKSQKKATYWFEPTKVKNLTVKEYEDPNLGDSARHGDFMMAGTLHIQPERAVWDVEIPVSGKWNLAEHGASGTIAIQTESKSPEARLASMAIDYDEEDQIMRMLGKVEFVSYEEPSRQDPGAWKDAARILGNYTSNPTDEGRGDMSDWAVNTLRENYNRGEMAKMFREELSNARGMKPTVEGLKRFLSKPSSTKDELARAAIFLQLVAKGQV